MATAVDLNCSLWSSCSNHSWHYTKVNLNKKTSISSSNLIQWAVSFPHIWQLFRWKKWTRLCVKISVRNEKSLLVLFLPPALLRAWPDLWAPAASSPLGDVRPHCATPCSTSAANKKLDSLYSGRIELRLWRGIEPPHTPTITWWQQEEATPSLTPALDWETWIPFDEHWMGETHRYLHVWAPALQAFYHIWLHRPALLDSLHQWDSSMQDPGFSSGQEHTWHILHWMATAFIPFLLWVKTFYIHSTLGHKYFIINNYVQQSSFSPSCEDLQIKRFLSDWGKLNIFLLMKLKGSNNI